jgi:hypothetical protein
LSNRSGALQRHIRDVRYAREVGTVEFELRQAAFEGAVEAVECGEFGFGVEALRFGLRALRFGLGALRFGLGALRFGFRALCFGGAVVRFGLDTSCASACARCASASGAARFPRQRMRPARAWLRLHARRDRRAAPVLRGCARSSASPCCALRRLQSRGFFEQARVFAPGRARCPRRFAVTMRACISSTAGGEAFDRLHGSIGALGFCAQLGLQFGLLDQVVLQVLPSPACRGAGARARRRPRRFSSGRA